jgi:hypothetical protein
MLYNSHCTVIVWIGANSELKINSVECNTFLHAHSYIHCFVRDQELNRSKRTTRGLLRICHIICTTASRWCCFDSVRMAVAMFYYLWQLRIRAVVWMWFSSAFPVLCFLSQRFWLSLLCMLRTIFWCVWVICGGAKMDIVQHSCSWICWLTIRYVIVLNVTSVWSKWHLTTKDGSASLSECVSHLCFFVYFETASCLVPVHAHTNNVFVS